jgi:hypothetical protein
LYRIFVRSGSDDHVLGGAQDKEAFDVLQQNWRETDPTLALQLELLASHAPASVLALLSERRAHFVKVGLPRSHAAPKTDCCF